MEYLDLSLVPGAPKLPGNGPQHERLFERAYECLGSRNNDKVFMIVDGDINDAKNFVCLFLHIYYQLLHLARALYIIPLH